MRVGFKQYMKLPLPIEAKLMDEPFVVETLEGTMQGKAGDYLVVGVDGEEYPCDGAIFRKTYEEVPYLTGTGQRLGATHVPDEHCEERCVIHNPSDHCMRDFPTHWREDRGLMERICPHGIGHPDPDHLAFVERVLGTEQAQAEGVHGCDGCCG
jgi:hypothetical protein